MSWIELKLNIPQPSLDEVSGYLFALGCEGINVTDQGIKIYFNKYRWSNEVKIGIQEYLSHFIPGFSLRNLRVTAVTEHDWMKNWKTFFKPIRIGNRIIVQPPWEKAHTQPGEIAITITPKMAFGTGHHETTQLIMAELERRISDGMSVLDVGTGSGILAIVAEKFGAQGIIAIDTDIQALKNAEENIGLNKSKHIRIYLSNLEQLNPMEFDVLCANLNRNIVLKYVDHFHHFLKEDGLLLISGLLRRDESAIIEAYQSSGYSLVGKNAQKEWLMLVMNPPAKEKENESSY